MQQRQEVNSGQETSEPVEGPPYLLVSRASRMLRGLMLGMKKKFLIF